MEEIFTYNPTLEVVFVTSDEQFFYNENDAKAYAKSLKDKAIIELKNPNLHEEIEVDFEHVSEVQESEIDSEVSIVDESEVNIEVPTVDEPILTPEVTIVEEPEIDSEFATVNESKVTAEVLKVDEPTAKVVGNKNNSNSKK